MHVVFRKKNDGKIWVLMKVGFPLMAILSILMGLTYKIAYGIMTLNLIKLMKKIRKRRILAITK